MLPQLRQAYDEIDRICKIEAALRQPPKVFITASGDVEIITPPPSPGFLTAMQYLTELISKETRRCTHDGPEAVIDRDGYRLQALSQCSGWSE